MVKATISKGNTFDLELLQQEHPNLIKHLEAIQIQLEEILA